MYDMGGTKGEWSQERAVRGTDKEREQLRRFWTQVILASLRGLRLCVADCKDPRQAEGGAQGDAAGQLGRTLDEPEDRGAPATAGWSLPEKPMA